MGLTGKKLYCRSFQAAMKLGNYAIKYPTPEVLEGPGQVDRLGAFLKEKNLNDILIVTGEGMRRRGQVQPLLDGLEENGIRYVLQCYTTPDPTSDDVEAGYETYRTQDCKAIVALGGGSRIDCAKAIAAKAVHPKKTVAQLQGVLKVHRRVPTLIAIPTTAGAGSETTVAAVITDSATHRKAAINDPFLVPKYAVLDPTLTLTLSPYMTAITGLDAMAHAVEAYTNHTYNTGWEDHMAKMAVLLIYRNLLTVCNDGTDLKARQNMQLAALYAGRAFTRGCVGYVHALGHALGGLYGVPHGLAMAVLLPEVLDAYGEAVYKPLAVLAELCDMPGISDKDMTSSFIHWIRSVNEDMNLTLPAGTIREEDIDKIITWADREANPLYPVPVIWGREEFRRVIERVRG